MTLPIVEAMPRLASVLAAGNAVLEAPPGAGKTTHVPLALRDAAWLAGQKIVMLEPRRLATRAAARRMAATLSERVGETVGYRMRLDSVVGPATRIEVVTEGIFTRRIQADPELAGIGLLIFDEFHERSLDADLGLALALDVQRGLRADLRLLVMSATLDGDPVARLIDGQRVTSEGRRYPVETRYVPRALDQRIEDAVATVVRRALGADDGDLLVFLPGAPEIRRVRERLADLPEDVDLHMLFGDLPAAEQDRALAPAPSGRRKIVLATAIAETSLTIEGVRVVVDSGLMRAPRFDPRSSMTRLETMRVSRAAADQRRGRAGRVAPGVCWRLWAEAEDRGLLAHSAPEIASVELTPLVLELAAWGSDAGALAWLDPPPQAALDAGRQLLQRLEALDQDGRITAHGRAMIGPVHPRLAHMILRAEAVGQGALACDIAALLQDRDPLRASSRSDVDLRSRLEMLAERRPGIDRAAIARIRESARDLRRRFGVRGERGDQNLTGPLLAWAYPDRVAQRREERGAFRLSFGGGARVDPADALAGADYLAIADLDGAADGRVFLAAPLDEAAITASFKDQMIVEDVVRWDDRSEAVIARRERRFGTLVLGTTAIDADSARVTAAMLEGVRRMGLGGLNWDQPVQGLRARVAFLRRHDEGAWPDLSDAALLASLETWLAPFLGRARRRADLASVDLHQALRALLPYPLTRRLDELAPTHVEVPSGSRIAIDYSGAEPSLSVRLQEMFGLSETPRVAGGRVPLVVQLLSPARRPVQVTRDLASFWRSGYREVRADLRGRYPKHYWPENPLEATPTRRVRPN